jgi:transcriptional regulator with XRE-family HTH domain
MEPILERIIQELKAQGKLQKDLTDFLGLTHNIFGNWKSGRNTSYKKYIHAIAEYLNVSVEYLKGETEQKEKPSLENEERLLELYELTKGLDENEIIALKAFAAGLKANRK